MSGPEFFQTRMGQQFYEATMPALVKQIARVADRLETIEREPDAEPEAEHHDQRIDRLITELGEAANVAFGEIQQTDGRDEAEAFMGIVQAKLHDAVGYPVDGAGEAVKLLARRRGISRAAALAKQFTSGDLSPTIPEAHQREVLRQFADFLEQHAAPAEGVD